MTSPSHRYSSVVLGFAEEAPASVFHPTNFTSKAGGLPVWLYRSPGSAPSAPRCAVCKQPQRFLLQIYAPVEPSVAAHHSAFHRVLYIAICPSASCQRSHQCATVLRAQLPRRNRYYLYHAAEGEAEVDNVDVCVLCGFGAQNRCGACHKISYCGKGCQSTDWKLAHKEECAGDLDKEDAERKRVQWRFREVEIVTEDHPTPGSSDDEDDSEDEGDEENDEGKALKEGGDRGSEGVSSSHENAELNGDSEVGVRQDDSPRSRCGQGDMGSDADAEAAAQKYGKNEHVSQDKAGVSVHGECIRGTFQDADADELPEELFRGRVGAGRHDRWGARFQRVVSYAPSQVVRYSWDGEALWAAGEGRCEGGGRCERCGAERVFELQVMPQLGWFVRQKEGGLSIADVARRLRDGMEWATVVVFSCGRSCETGEEFVREGAWVQRFAEGR